MWMLSLSEDLRESNDSLDTILKRHKTNLHDAFKGGALDIEKKKPKTSDCTYEEFKDCYYNRLDFSEKDIIKHFGISIYKYRKWVKQAIAETGYKRLGVGRKNERIISLDLDSKYLEFKRLYMGGVKVETIKSELGITGKTQCRFRERVYRETGYRRYRSKNDG